MGSWLGKVLVVINGRIYHYGVTADVLDDPQIDPSGRFRAIYTFNLVEPNVPQVPPKITLRVLDAVLYSHSSWDTESKIPLFRPNLNLLAIRFALSRLELANEGTTIDLLSQNAAQSQLLRPSGHSELRKAILTVFSMQFEADPEEGIAASDLLSIFDATYEDVGKALRVLADQGWLVNRKFKRVEWAGQSENAWYLNPTKADDIKNSELGLPKSGLLIFLSYSSVDKLLAGLIKENLEKLKGDLNLSVFLAHEDIEPEEIWIKEIKLNLTNCTIFMPLFSKNFLASWWANQEAGYAFAANKRIIPLKTDRDPDGLLRDIQAMPVNEANVQDKCRELIRIISSH